MKIYYLEIRITFFSLRSSHVLNGWTVYNDVFHMEFIQNSTCVSFYHAVFISLNYRDSWKKPCRISLTTETSWGLWNVPHRLSRAPTKTRRCFRLVSSDSFRIMTSCPREVPSDPLTITQTLERRERKERTRHDFAQNCRDMVNQSLPLSAYSRPLLMNGCGFIPLICNVKICALFLRVTLYRPT